MKEYALLFLFLVALGICAPVASAQRIVYVNHAASGANDGGSWEDAFSSLQDALVAAENGDEIWVAAGTYRPDQGVGIAERDRDASFILKNDVSIYGGFSGNELSREERNFSVNETILSGDLLENDNDNIELEEPTRSDNSYHVVTAKPGTDTTAVLDGFSIRSGHANPFIGFRYGGGLVVEFSEESPSRLNLSYLSFEENLSQECGGAVANLGGRFVLHHAHFTRNIASATSFCGGGGIYHRPFPERELARLDEVIFEGNKANQGGAVSVFGGNIFVTRSIFLFNRSSTEGGAVFHNQVNRDFGGEAIYANVAFLGNATSDFGGGAMSNDGTTTTIYNALFSGNEAIDTGSGALGGAIVSFEHSKTYIIQSTFTNNVARSGGSISSRQDGDFYIYNSIFWGDASTVQGKEIFDIDDVNQDTLEIGFSLVEGQLPERTIDKGGILFSDPMFAEPLGNDGIAGTLDDDLRLIAGSVAIDVGTSEALPLDTLDLDRDGDRIEPLPIDLENNRRIVDGGNHGEIVDLGAYEFGSTPSVNIEFDEAHNDQCPNGNLTNAYPNPFFNRTKLSFCLNRTDGARIILYDTLGRERLVLFDKVIQGGVYHLIEVEGDDLPFGVYFVKLKSTSGNAVESVILVK